MHDLCIEVTVQRQSSKSTELDLVCVCVCVCVRECWQRYATSFISFSSSLSAELLLSMSPSVKEIFEDILVCLCVCVCVCGERERERDLLVEVYADVLKAV